MKYRDYILIALVVILLLTTLIFRSKFKKEKKEFSDFKAKIESFKNNNIIIDSIKYETATEIWKKDIIINDTIITDKRTLYLVEKYGQ